MAVGNTQWYYVLSNQQKGPIDEAMVERLIANNVINANTLMWQAGMAGWLPLRSTSLCNLLPSVSAPPPVPFPQAQAAYPASPYAQQYAQPYAQPYGQPMDAARVQAQKNASTALTCAIISIFCFSIILGPIALVNAGNAKKVLVPGDSGYGSATAAQVISWISMALWVLSFIIYFANAAGSY